jgi:hypothetical protein
MGTDKLAWEAAKTQTGREGDKLKILEGQEQRGNYNLLSCFTRAA